MSTVDDLLRGLESLAPEDRRKVVDWIMDDPSSATFRDDIERHASKLAILPGDVLSRAVGRLFGIERDLRVCGGEPRIVRTRIPIWVLEQMRRQGISEADILRSYPSLRAADLVNAWSYVDAHRAEIDAQILENEDA